MSFDYRYFLVPSSSFFIFFYLQLLIKYTKPVHAPSASENCPICMCSYEEDSTYMTASAGKSDAVLVAMETIFQCQSFVLLTYSSSVEVDAAERKIQ